MSKITEEELIELDKISEIEFRRKLFREIKEIKEQVEPMYAVFTSVNGFNRISVTLMKLLAMVGGTIIAVYTVVEFFRRISKP